jgi:hypothetical protein
MGVVGVQAAALFPASRNPGALGAVLHILFRVIEARLRQRGGCQHHPELQITNRHA